MAKAEVGSTYKHYKGGVYEVIALARMEETRAAFVVYRETAASEVSRMAVELDREEDGRFIAEISDLPGVMAYGSTEAEAKQRVEALALEVIADRVEHGETWVRLRSEFEANVSSLSMAEQGPVERFARVVGVPAVRAVDSIQKLASCMALPAGSGVSEISREVQRLQDRERALQLLRGRIDDALFGMPARNDVARTVRMVSLVDDDRELRRMHSEEADRRQAAEWARDEAQRECAKERARAIYAEENIKAMKRAATVGQKLSDGTAEGAALRVAEEQRDKAYTERNRLLALLTTIFPSWGARDPFPSWGARDPKNSSPWDNVVFLKLPTGQVSWHVHDAQVLEDFSHVRISGPHIEPWDGHTDDEKWARVKDAIRLRLDGASSGGRLDLNRDVHPPASDFTAASVEHFPSPAQSAQVKGTSVRVALEDARRLIALSGNVELNSPQQARHVRGALLALVSAVAHLNEDVGV